jgi:hypothetical protein
MEDTRERISIDPRRIYASGFSGGSRVAMSVAIVDGGIAGVIGCAAGFPSVEQQINNKFDYFGMVGDYDFNLTEMEQLDAALEKSGFSHQLLTSGGIHGWPSATDFRMALLWIQVNAMKEHIQPQNDTLIAALKNDYNKRSSAAISSGEWIKAQELLVGMIRALDGVTDIPAIKKQLSELVSQAGYKNAATIQQQLQPVEASQQQELAKQFTTQDEKWWAGKIAELNKKAHNAKNKQEAQMYQRLLNYLGLVCYMSITHALDAGELANAMSYLKIFKLADPKNPDHSYLAAVYYMKNGDQAHAISSLSDAASAGYSEVATLISNPVFTNIRDDARFKEAVSRVWDNNKNIYSDASR